MAAQVQENGDTKNPAELTLELYRILEPHSSEVRQRAIQAVQVTLGDQPLQQAKVLGTGTLGPPQDLADMKLGPKALRWTQKHGVTRTILEEVFHFTEAGVEISASSVPGPSRREMTVNCYLLTGVRGLLATDAASVGESDAIALCKRLTAYDKNNHTTNRQAVGNRMTGAKPTFTLTGPGETAAAELIKQMASSRD